MPLRTVVLMLLLITTSTAAAHPGHDSGGLAGMLHPLTGTDHLLAMLAVGWWSSSLGAGRWWQPPLVFASTAFVAALATHLSGVHLPAVEVQIGLSLLVLAALLAFRPPLGSATGLLLVGVLAVSHGAAHGSELAGPALPWLLGMLGSTLLLHLLGVLAGIVLRRLSGRRVEQMAGVALAVFATAMLWTVLA